MKNSPLAEIENKYGEFIFRTALCQLICVGTQALKDETEVENQIAEINGNSSVGAFFTTDYQLGILNCAVEISAFTPLEILKYVKCNVSIG